jgi:hypothetical protein
MRPEVFKCLIEQRRAEISQRDRPTKTVYRSAQNVRARFRAWKPLVSDYLKIASFL